MQKFSRSVTSKENCKIPGKSSALWCHSSESISCATSNGTKEEAQEREINKNKIATI